MKLKAYAPDLFIWYDNDQGDEVAPNVMPNAIYYTMNNDAAFEHLTRNNGNYDAEKDIDLSRLVADDDGNLLNVVYDATALTFSVAYAQGMTTAGRRPYVPVDLNSYLTYDPNTPGVIAVAGPATRST